MGNKQLSPKEQATLWKKQLKNEQRSLKRDIRKIQREERKVLMEAKRAGKQGDREAAKILAKEIVNSRKATERLMVASTQINSVIMEIQNNMSTMKVMKSIKASTQVTQYMNSLIRMPEINKTCMNLARIIEEMVDETLDMDEESLEDEADEQVDQIMDEILQGTLGKSKGTVGLKTLEKQKQQVETKTQEKEKEKDGELLGRIGAL
ncbi:charged multivesicular body protein [Anaeramoeba flamelloides]|uniref:Charged multivesicular body protein n=1 Tax=Anaeramoeba flamelloides TaxID=1746091 RepID=A0AAV7ZAC2_9EUKA|nr:charged multivesicular body protein [Anaeramoeba flamelloides]KAJ3437921.1 charged multivesicular body protein [Anaeramoeba flamelloides]KAJ6231055.1 charged multivesicular body protein [Anaeramoeba flamelloides]KAJ6245047.1 charged multivesicular body protein [Anaeramoeba flamelloides]